MPAALTLEELFARLDALGIPHRTVTHPPVFTVAEAAARPPAGRALQEPLPERQKGLLLARRDA
ncbi:MAG TPA: hypothetical protein VL985_09850 [Stellaceae bacterium]|nr:hypothetical protein [Stellaceae bacterium]